MTLAVAFTVWLVLVLLGGLGWIIAVAFADVGPDWLVALGTRLSHLAKFAIWWVIILVVGSAILKVLGLSIEVNR